MEIIETTETLFCQYPGQNNPQGVYIEIDPEQETISAHYNAQIGNAVPFSVWHERVHRFPLQFVPTVEAANSLMEEILPLAERLAAGYSSEWDGHNRVGRLTEDAQSASDEIMAECDKYEQDEFNAQKVWNGDFLYEDIKEASRVDATDEDIAARIKKIEEAAEAEGAEISIDLEEEIKAQRTHNREREEWGK